MKKIVIIISDITKCAGTERVVSGLANYLVDNGFYVEIVSLFSSRGTSYFGLAPSIIVHHLAIGSYEAKSVVRKLYGLAISLFQCYRYLRRTDNDILIGTSRNTNIIAWLSKKKRHVIGCEHFAANVPMNKIFKWFRNHIYQRLDRLVVLTRFDLAYYTQRGIKAVLIQNSISIQGQQTDKKNIAIAIGRHSIEKNFKELIAIWHTISQINPTWELQIIGDGLLAEENKQYAESLECKNIRFLPFQQDIASYYSKASLYLMTSLYEALPMVLLEAQTCGCVCIAYDCDTGPRDIIENGKDGYIIPMGQRQKFVDKIQYLISHPNIIKEMGVQARRSSEKYAPDRIMPQCI